MRLSWSEVAKAELAEIRQFSLQRWGREVTTQYIAGRQAAVRTAAAYSAFESFAAPTG